MPLCKTETMESQMICGLRCAHWLNILVYWAQIALNNRITSHALWFLSNWLFVDIRHSVTHHRTSVCSWANSKCRWLIGTNPYWWLAHWIFPFDYLFLLLFLQEHPWLRLIWHELYNLILIISWTSRIQSLWERHYLTLGTILSFLGVILIQLRARDVKSLKIRPASGLHGFSHFWHELEVMEL